MTAIAIRFPSRRAERPEPAKRRFGRKRRAHGSNHESEAEMTTKMQAIRALIERDAYQVDAARVADAIVARLIAGSSLREPDSR